MPKPMLSVLPELMRVLMPDRDLNTVLIRLSQLRKIHYDLLQRYDFYPMWKSNSLYTNEENQALANNVQEEIDAIESLVQDRVKDLLSMESQSV